MDLSEKNKKDIAQCILKAVGKFDKSVRDEEEVTDFYISVNPDEGCLKITDDDENVLSSIKTEELTECDSEEPEGETTSLLRKILHDMRSEGCFENLNIMLPYSFLLTDISGQTVTDLLIMDDDDTIIIGDELMQGMDEDLDNFLENLLKV